MTAKLNLIIQLLMGAALLAGMVLAKRKRFRAHAICQSAVVLLNLIPIFYFMGPIFQRAVRPGLPEQLRDSFYSIATAHHVLGTIVEILGIYVLLVAGTKLVPARLRFKNWKRWMRIELVLWWLTIALGVATYFVWYGGGTSKSSTASSNTPTASSQTSSSTSAPSTPQKIATVEISNFAFTPKDLTIDAGTMVIWKNTAGRHTVFADDISFKSEMLAPGAEFRQSFPKAGSYRYYCSIHGAAGGTDMAGTITVKPAQEP
jgi:plastocyanin/uncharacterized membrane protein YozB (DUF420 family)